MTEDERDAELDRLKSLQDIRHLMYRYCRGVDRLDRAALLSVYHEDAVDDHGCFVGGPAGFADWALTMHRRAHLSTQHIITNHICELDGDVAHAETYYTFAGMNVDGPPFTLSGGRYVDRLERRNGRWGIVLRKCLRDWISTDTKPESGGGAAFSAGGSFLPPAEMELLRQSAASRRDAEDPSYDRPLRLEEGRFEAGAAALRAAK